MNHSPFWPLVWKEYRASRSFWLAMAAMGLVAQAAVLGSVRPTERDWWLHSIALLISGGFAVGIGGTLFAVEYEERTIALLRTLPVRARQLGAAKVLSALAGLAALFGVLWLAATIMADWRALPARQAKQLWSVGGLACLEGLAWGVLYSLVLRRPLLATAAAAVTVALIDTSGAAVVSGGRLATVSFGETVSYRMICLLLVAVVDAALLPRWLDGRRPDKPRLHVRLAQSLGRYLQCPETTWRRSLGHLLWQTFREGWTGFLLLLFGAPVAFLLVALFCSRMGLPFFPRVSVGAETHSLRIFLPLALLTAINGVLVFRADQIHGPRFFTAQGVSPRMIWLSRQLMWGFWLWALAATLVGLFFFLLFGAATVWLRGYKLAGARIESGDFLVAAISIVVDGLLTLKILLPAFAGGQLASLLIRRGLLAGVLGVVLGVTCSLWAWLMHQGGASWWWSVAPLIAGLFAASWLRMPGWLLERTRPRVWLAPAAAVLVPVAALAVAVPAYRVMQIPAVFTRLPWPARSAEALTAARATADLYQQAMELYLTTRGQSVPAEPGPPGLREMDEGWVQPIADLAIEASQSEANLVLLPTTERRDTIRRIEELKNLLEKFAAQQQQAGKLDEAFDVDLAILRIEAQLSTCVCTYVSTDDEYCDRGPFPAPYHEQTFRAIQNWAGARGQTAERLTAAIARFKECYAAFPPPVNWLLPAYQDTLLSIDDLPAAVAAGIVPARELTLQDWLLNRLPWERARQRRLLDYWTARQREGIAAPVMLAVRLGYPGTVVSESLPMLSQPLGWQFLCQETDYRATLILLALAAWHAEHEEFPDRLDQLIGAPLDVLPLDPVTGKPFLYFPPGSGNLWPAWTTAGAARPGKPPMPPFLWSALNLQSYTQGGVPAGTIYPIAFAKEENP